MNARYVSQSEVLDPIDIIVCDVSFISLTVALPAVLRLAKPNARLVTLIKPQFEVAKGQVGKGGVVRDSALHDEVCHNIQTWLETQSHWAVIGIVESPLTGPKGNKEFLMFAEKNDADC